MWPPGPRLSHCDAENNSSVERVPSHVCSLVTEVLVPEQDGVPDPRNSPDRDDRDPGFPFLVEHGSHQSVVTVSKKQNTLRNLQLLLDLERQ